MSEDKQRAEEKGGPEVAIVILNWNNYEDTARCLSALKEIQYPNYRVIVVDNNSTDGSGGKLSEEFEWCEFIFNDENLGFAAGNNVGIDRALNQGTDYVLLLNNDTIPEPDFLGHLVDTAESNENAGIVGGIIRFTQSSDIWYAQGNFSPTLVKATNKRKPKSETNEYETEHVVGALMLLSSDFLDSVGNLNEDYFFSFEDTEIAYRAQKSNWKVMVNPKSRVAHEVGSTSGDGNAFRHYHSMRNRVHFAENNLSFSKFLVFILFLVSSRFFRFIQWLYTDQTELIMATILGVWDHYWSNEFRKLADFD